MKYILVVLVALVIACAYAEEHCIDKAFETQALVIDPRRHFDDISHIYFDSSTNKQRIDIQIMEPVTRKINIYLRYDLGHGYEYDPSTKHCRSWDLHESKLPQFCLAQNATHAHDIVIGGTLNCEVWEEKVRGNEVRLVVAPGPHFGVPVNLVTSGGHIHGSIFQEFWDFKAYDTLPDQKVFDLPAECKQAQSRSLKEEPSKAVERAKDLLGLFNDKF